MGAVYLAADSTIGQQVAIKIVRTDAADYPDIASAIRAAERFKQEARAVASLDHLHILPLYRYSEEQTDNGQRAYMVMQYRPEGSLWDWIRQRASQALSDSHGISPMRSPGQDSLVVAHAWPLDVYEASEYLRQAASALQYAHDRGIIHRDIKPANFLLRFEEGQPVHLLLSDFGLAKFFASSSATSHIFGTPIYMAPEQFDGEAGPESDQYALAIMIYYLLTGHPPFEGDPMRLMHQHLFTEPPLPRGFNPALPEGVEAALLQALSKKPSERHPSIAAFANAFCEGIAETTVVPIRRTPSQAGPEAPTVANSSSAVQPAVPQAGLLQASPDTPTVAQVTPAQASAALAPTVFPLTPRVGNSDGRAETPRGRTSPTFARPSSP